MSAIGSDSFVVAKNLAPFSKEGYVSKKLLDFEILYIFSQGPQTGYNIKKSLNLIFGKRVSFGTIYPHLESLRDREMIELLDNNNPEYVGSIENFPRESSARIRTRRIFALTAKGVQEYEMMHDELFKIAELVKKSPPRKMISTISAV